MTESNLRHYCIIYVVFNHPHLSQKQQFSSCQSGAGVSITLPDEPI